MNVDIMQDSIDNHNWYSELARSGYYKNVGEESRKTWLQKANCARGFFYKYMGGRNAKGLDIGYAGYLENVTPILPTAIGVDLNTPGYDGRTLPFLDNSQDYVYSSHCLEHISDRKQSIREWYRVTKVNSYIIIIVPLQWLYERKESLPSHWNADHKIFFTSSSILKEIEEALPINSFRIRHLRENDEDHIYNIPVEIHASGSYDVEIVLEKIK